MTVHGLAVDVVRKDIKHLHLAVYPPNGRIRVAVPLRVNDEAVRLAVITRLPWIKRQQSKFVAQDRQSVREYVTGESHYYQGRRYRLNVLYHDGAPSVVIRNRTTIDLTVRTGSDRRQRERRPLRQHQRCQQHEKRHTTHHQPIDPQRSSELRPEPLHPRAPARRPGQARPRKRQQLSTHHGT